MPAIAFDIIVLLGIAYCGFLGLSRGFFATAVAGVEVLGALILAILLHEPLAGLIGPLFMDSFGFFMPSDFTVQPWAVFLCFTLVFWGSLAAVWKLANPKFIEAEILPMPLIDQLGGGLAGGFAGALFLGAILINWSMCPLLAGIPVPAGGMWLDVGSLAMRAAGQFAGERQADGTYVPVDGEPAPSDGIEGPLRVSSEAWRDLNTSGQWDFEDPFRDTDGNGTMTKEFKYVDLDGDRQRRVGLVEKYVVGVWDATIRVENREPGAGGPPKPPAPARPNEAQPAEPKPAAADDRAPATPPPNAEPAVDPKADPKAPAQKPTKESPPEDDF
jgi:uncharacterized membrane protein required for colicin V production